MPFMAEDAWEGKITRLYRHDCESFAWALLWICCHYDNGKEINNAPLSELITYDYIRCFKKNTPFSLSCDTSVQPLRMNSFGSLQENFSFGHLTIEPGEDRHGQKVEPTTNEVLNIYRHGPENTGFVNVL
jgi:hypothetical protein